MTYTHNYIPYNCDIILIQEVHALTYPFPHKSSHSHQTIPMPKHMDIYGPFHTNWDYFYSPKTEQVGCPRAAHFSYISSSWWNRIPYPFPVSYSPKQNLMHKFQHKQPNQFLDVHGLSKMSKKIFTLRFQDLGPIKRPLTASTQHKHQQST